MQTIELYAHPEKYTEVMNRCYEKFQQENS